MNKEISASKTSIQSLDLHKLLQLLNTANETEVQVKLFTILAAYLVSNCDEKDIIIKCHTVYDKVNSFLNRCLPLKTATTLDLVTALVYSDEEVESLTRRHGLAMYARNRVRVSGCLSTMATMFSSCMMFQDTWKSLCRTLAETCNSSELNQSYCSHLVPLCIQKCNKGCMDVYTLLQSLLRNHERNIQLFLDNEGITLFTREHLENDLCMQLLVTLVQSSRKAASVVRESRIFDCCRELIRHYGKYSKMGQWAKIVLYYVESYIKDIAYTKITNINNKTEQEIKMLNDKRLKSTQIPNDKKLSLECDTNIDQDDTGELFQNIVKELFHSKANFRYLQSAISNIRSQAINLSMEQKCMKTHNLLHTENKQTNIQSTKESDFNKTKTSHKQKSNTRKTNEMSFQPPKINSHVFAKYYNAKETKHDETKTSDKSREAFTFTFLLQDTRYGRNIHQMSTNHTLHKNNITNNLAMLNTNIGNNSPARNYNNNEIPYNDAYDAQTINASMDLDEFRPISVSTPKSRKESTTKFQTSYSRYNSTSQFSVNQNKRESKIKDRRVRKQKKSKQTKPTKVKELIRRSMSSRFFNAINDSCTTLVKTVKNIFVTKKDKSFHEESKNSDNDNSSVKTCSYSFTNYMRKRDAVLVNENTDIQESSMRINDNACKTCNDTAVLERKLIDDDHLKKTIKKLKLGINLYGCDFKRISKNFWPRESYMTPAVLYNLYRKLIVK